MDLKDILFMFKREQEYAERKNHIIFIVLGIITTLTTIFASKIPLGFLILIIIFIVWILLTNLLSFLPQGRKIDIPSFIIKKLVNKHSKKYLKENNNIFNLYNWKNFNVNQLNELMEFFKIETNNENEMLSEQILITSKITYIKMMFFTWSCFLISILMCIFVAFIIYQAI